MTTQNAVLVVDDEPNVRATVSAYLEAKSLAALCAASAESALRLFRNAQPPVVVTDVGMPGMDGIQLLRIIKQERPATAVIVMTGLAGERSAIEVLRAGAAYYLRKPFRLSELERLIRKCLSWLEPGPGSDFAHPYLRDERLEFEIPNDLAAIGPVVEFLWRRARLDIGDAEAGPFRCGLEETLINAVEHGNLGISFEEKRAALDEERYPALLAERSQEATRRGTVVHLSYQRQTDKIQCVVTDQGEGFDWRAWCGEANSNRLPVANGRGIFLARIHYHEVLYNRQGNQATLIWHLAGRPTTEEGVEVSASPTDSRGQQIEDSPIWHPSR